MHNLTKIDINSLGDSDMDYSDEQLEIEVVKATEHYSDDKFWDKLKAHAKKAGSSVVYAVLLLYYTLQRSDVPIKTKATIIGALGYFIMPIDLVPDFLVGMGYVDDLGALGIALLQVVMYIDENIKFKAKGKLQEWFGADVDTSYIDAKINQ
jgi:uncharacterized membrane protein YkvA (DUF1232 family)